MQYNAFGVNLQSVSVGKREGDDAARLLPWRCQHFEVIITVIYKFRIIVCIPSSCTQSAMSGISFGGEFNTYAAWWITVNFFRMSGNAIKFCCGSLGNRFGACNGHFEKC